MQRRIIESGTEVECSWRIVGFVPMVLTLKDERLGPHFATVNHVTFYSGTRYCVVVSRLLRFILCRRLKHIGEFLCLERMRDLTFRVFWCWGP